MKMSFRWYGHNDPVTLEKIRQIPGMGGIVSAIYDVPVGEVWPLDEIQILKNTVEQNDLELTAIESIPVHEDIKMGLPGRDKYIDNFIKTLQNLGTVGIDVVCYNFMPVFDWMRSRLDYKLPDGSRALIYEQEKVKEMDPAKGELDLPGWDTSYEQEELQDLLSTYRDISDEDLWDNLKYFLVRIIEPAEEAGVKMAIHPDDPPWSIFGLPRIITDREDIKRLTELVDSPANGLAICSGSLGADPENDLPAIIREFGRENRIHFAHVRNIKITGKKCFQESAHRSEAGSLDIYEIMKAYHDIGFRGPLRPDHGRMIWGEEGKPGYGLYDRALGATYLNGIWEALEKNN